jgi:general secretion pathway protein G
MIKRHFKNLKGFTLIELLVVIAILGLMAGLVFSNMAGARERARDAKRKSDLKEIQKALQLYKQDNNSQYPDELSGLINEEDLYIKQIPEAPLEDEDYEDGYEPSADHLDYVLFTCLENASDPQGESDATTCPISGKKFELTAP